MRFARAHLLDAQRLAVGGAGVLLLGRSVADVAVDDEERRPVPRALEEGEGLRELAEVVCVVDVGDGPAVGRKRAAASSEKDSVVLPSRLMWLLS